MIKALVPLLLLMIQFSAAQTTPHSATVPSASTMTNKTEPLFYPFPVELKAQIRDLQYSSDQLEIRNNKLQLEIEQNKAKQRDMLDAMRTIAFEFATKNHIDLSLNDLDPQKVGFARKLKK